MNVDDSALEQNWHAFAYAVVDFEGTGKTRDAQERIVELGGVIVQNGQLDLTRTYHALVNPGTRISWQARYYAHGMSNTMVSHQPAFEEIQEQFVRFLQGKVLIIHNASYDLGLLQAHLPAYQPPLVLDTLTLSRRVHHEQRKHNLDQLIAQMGLASTLENLPLPAGQKRHRALYDAVATAYAFRGMMATAFPDGITLADLALICRYESERKRRNGTAPLPEIVPRKKRVKPPQASAHSPSRVYLLGESNDPASIPALMEYTKSPSPNERRLAASGLGKLSPYPAVYQAIPHLRALLNDPFPQVQQYAAKALGLIGDNSVIPNLELLKANTDKEYIRRTVGTAMQEIQQRRR